MVKNGEKDTSVKSSWDKKDIVCSCGQAHTLQGLLNGLYCSNCQKNLSKELF